MSEELVKQKDGAIEITVNIQGTEYQRNLSDDLAVTEDHIQEVLIQAPGKATFWNMLYQKQRSVVQKLKVTMERTYAELNTEYRRNADQDGKKISQDEVAAMILCNKDYQEIQDTLLVEQEKSNVLKAATDGIESLKSTLISLSANMRSQIGIHVKEEKKSKWSPAATEEVVRKGKENAFAAKERARRNK